jgi:hypothetical protein
MPMPAQICQIWLRGGMISNWSAFAQIYKAARRAFSLIGPSPSVMLSIDVNPDGRR